MKGTERETVWPMRLSSDPHTALVKQRSRQVKSDREDNVPYIGKVVSWARDANPIVVPYLYTHEVVSGVKW